MASPISEERKLLLIRAPCSKQDLIKEKYTTATCQVPTSLKWQYIFTAKALVNVKDFT
jgi:hypothetical protein